MLKPYFDAVGLCAYCAQKECEDEGDDLSSFHDRMIFGKVTTII